MGSGWDEFRLGRVQTVMSQDCDDSGLERRGATRQITRKGFRQCQEIGG